MLKRIELSAREGRIHLRLAAEWLGSDLHVTLTGGRAHIGSLALAVPGMAPEELSSPGHREGELANMAATRLQAALKCTVAVAAGIHYDRITKSEIELVYKLAASLADQYIQIWERARQC